MENLPEKIYLQVNPESDPNADDFNQLSDVTWSKDKINNNDTEYIKASLFNKVEKTISKKDLLEFGFKEVEFEYELQITDSALETDELGPMKILLGQSPNGFGFSLLLCEGATLKLHINSLAQLRVFINSIAGYAPCW